MKRWIRRISPWRAAFGSVLCVFLGLFCTLAVAVVCVACVPEERLFWIQPGLKNERLTNDEQVWLRERHADLLRKNRNAATATRKAVGFVRVDFFEVKHWQFTDVRFVPTVSRSISAPLKAFASRVKAGWPFDALHGYSWTIDGRTTTRGIVKVKGEWVDREYPALLIWPGLLANTALYAVVAWALFFFTPSQIRRKIRRNRGCCPSCGYDLQGHSGGDTGCPECGWGREAESES